MRYVHATTVSKRHDGGFTLAEMLVVLAIVALAIAALPPLQQAPVGDRTMDATARDIAGVLRTARFEAIRTNQTRSVQFDVRHRTFGIEGRDQVRLLPRTVEVDVTVPVARERDGKRTTFQFFPDGSASGGSIRLRSGASSRLIVVEWLSGHIRTQSRSVP